LAHLDKTSVRNEVNQLKDGFEQLRAKGKINDEVLMLMKSLFMIIDLILSIFLERVTKKDSKNSSKPSSQTEKDESSLGQPGSHGKGKYENNAIAHNTRVIETVTLAKVHHCNVCGEDLHDTPCTGHERRTKIDIVFEKTVDHIDAQIKQCPACDSTVKAAFPSDRHGPLQYGDGLKAFVINLLVCQMVSLNRVQKLVKSMLSTLLSEASLLKFVLRLHQALKAWEDQAIAQLLKAPAINVDETSFRVDKQRHWIHVYCAGDITLKFLHRRRGLEAIEVINIIPRYGGAIIHDCWASYLSYSHCGHGLCGSHLLRELTFIVETNGYAWAVNMKRLLQETCQKVSQSKEKKLTDKALVNLQKRYRNILTRAEKELPPFRPNPVGNVASWLNQMRTTFWSDCAIMNRLFCFSQKIRMSHSPITGLSVICVCPKSSKRYRVVSGQPFMHRLIVESPAICRRWRTKDIILLLRFKWCLQGRINV